MNYEKAKVEVVKFNNEDVITVSAVPGHPVCTGIAAKAVGCGSSLVDAGLCFYSSKG